MRMTRISVSIVLPTVIVELAVCLALIYRKMRYGYKYRRIPLTRGKYAIVDPGDYEWLMRFKWHASDGRGGNFYARNRKMQQMHRMIMFGVKQEYSIQYTRLRQGYVGQAGHRKRRCQLVVDHINRNGLDNRRANLRVVTQTQNKWNNGQRIERYSSKYRGVSWHKHLRKWVAIISVDGRKRHLGYYTDEKEAARAFDNAAKELRGKYGVLNFPDS